MIKVTKEKNWGTCDIINIQNEEGNLYISFEKDLNLYFSYLGVEDKFDITINKDNGFLYECFDELYDSIQSEMPFKYSNSLYNAAYYYPVSECGLSIVDGCIKLYSEESSDKELSSSLSIKKLDDSYLVSMEKDKEKQGNSAYRLCVNNAVSIYDPYNVSFVIMYNKMRDYDFTLDNEKALEKGNSRVRKR